MTETKRFSTVANASQDLFVKADTFVLSFLLFFNLYLLLFHSAMTFTFQKRNSYSSHEDLRDICDDNDVAIDTNSLGSSTSRYDDDNE